MSILYEGTDHPYFILRTTIRVFSEGSFPGEVTQVEDYVTNPERWMCSVSRQMCRLVLTLKTEVNFTEKFFRVIFARFKIVNHDLFVFPV